MLYAESESSMSRIAVVLNDEQERAYVFAEIAPTGKKYEEVCSICGTMKKKE